MAGLIHKYMTTSTIDKSKTVKQILTEPCRVQKRNGYYSYDSFRQILLTHFLEVKNRTGKCFLAEPIDRFTYSLFRAAQESKHNHYNRFFWTIAVILELDFVAQFNKNIFYVDENLFRMLLETKLPARFNINRLFLSSFLLLLPKKNPLGLQSFVLGQSIEQVLQAVSPRISPSRVLCHEEVNIVLNDDYNGDDILEPHERFIFNFLLWQQSMHDKRQEVVKIDAPSKSMGFGKNSKSIIVPQVIGEGYRPKVIQDYQPTGTHASPRTHWRSGHWRWQPFGKKENPDYKTIWVEPVLVNP